MDLIEFLRARLDEDEREAQQQHIPVPTIVDMGKPRDEWPKLPGIGPDRRALREVEAKRRILDRYVELRASISRGELLSTLRLLALPYADHPDYRPEWKP